MTKRLRVEYLCVILYAVLITTASMILTHGPTGPWVVLLIYGCLQLVMALRDNSRPWFIIAVVLVMSATIGLNYLSHFSRLSGLIITPLILGVVATPTLYIFLKRTVHDPHPTRHRNCHTRP